MMKNILIVLVLVGAIFISGCVRFEAKETECQKLELKLDSYILRETGSIDMHRSECDKWFENGKPPIIVGGTLIKIEYVDIYKNTYVIYAPYPSLPHHWAYDLTFRGSNSYKEGRLFIITYSDKTIPYKIGQFYKFDLSDYCKTRNSGTFGGSFLDENLDAFQPLDC